MIAALKRLWRPAPVATRPDLAEFLDRHAAVITNRSVIGYVHVKTRMPLHELTREAPFAEAFERGRTEAYAAILADLIVLAEGLLRDAAAGGIADGLAGLYAEILARHPLPRHRPQGWGDEVDALRARLVLAAQTLPRRAVDIAEHSAARVYEFMPIHESLRGPDGPAIKANVQFVIVGLCREFETRLDRTALARELAA